MEMISATIPATSPLPPGALQHGAARCPGAGNMVAAHGMVGSRRGLFRAAALAAMALVVPSFSPVGLGAALPELRATNLIRIPFQTQQETLQWMEARKGVQTRMAARFSAFHDFQFTDRLAESQITFRQQVVDDASKDFMQAHYDHGTGVAVADVDGDGLLDIYFVNQQGGNQLWRNTGGGRFEDITAKAGVGLGERVSVGASFADVDNDGRPDLFVTTVRRGNVLFHNLGQGRFEDVSQSAGVDHVGHSSGAVFFDFNRDGLLDLFVCNVGVYTTNVTGRGGFYHALADAFKGHLHPERSEQSLLYQNLGGLKFRNVSKEMNLMHSGWSGDASFNDLERNGYPGLYVLSMSGPDAYYYNARGKMFENRTEQTFGKTPWGAMGLKFFDFDQDGLMDLYVTDMHSDMSPAQSDLGKKEVSLAFEKQKSGAWCFRSWTPDFFPQQKTNYIFGSAFYRNDGKGAFREISDQLGVETYWPWGVSVGDLNADGFEDMFVTAGMGYPFRYAINSVLLNEGGKRFFDSEFLLNVEPRIGGKTQIDYFTLDCSGADKENPLCLGKNGTLTVRSSTSSRSSVICDLDDDGDLDLVVNNMNDQPQVLFSNLTDKRKIHYLKLRLIGTVSNADGLGALVKVRAGGKIYTQYHDGKSGYLSQSSLPLYFGLGDATAVESVEVLWPSGKTQKLTENLPVNALLRITENNAR
jgi:hypothetical protein